MKNILRNITIVAIIVSVNAISGCKKDSTPTPTNTTTPTPPPSNSDTYSSLNAFYAANGVPMQTYTISGTTGGTFTTPQGTKVRIPANAFVDGSNQVITGPVTIQFKDIYKKSDMLLSNMPTMMIDGTPLKSGGEFFIKALSGAVPVHAGAGKSITVVQPNSLPTDPAMTAFIIDTATHAWDSTSVNAVTDTTGNYLYSAFGYFPVDSGSWGNTDDQSYFNAYTQTNLTLQTTDTLSKYDFEAYLIFTGINTTIEYHTYPYYYYAPLGLQCTLVVVAVRQSNSKLYSAFVPITITTNETVNYTLSQTTTANLKTQLSALN